MAIDTAEVTISRWESETNTPTNRNLRLLAPVFGVDWRYLRDGKKMAPTPMVETEIALDRVKALLEAHPEIKDSLLEELQKPKK